MLFDFIFFKKHTSSSSNKNICLLQNKSDYANLNVSNIVSKAKDYIEKMLEKEGITLENGYYYHNWNHTVDVFNRVNYLALKEGLDEEEIEMLQLAALFHDLGFVEKYDGHEIVSAKLARKWLLNEGYPDTKIKIIENIILATILTSNPKTKLEKIIKDADLDNLGREDFLKLGEDVRKELKAKKGVNFSDKEWYKSLKKLLDTTGFLTDTQKKERSQQLNSNKIKVKFYLYFNSLKEIYCNILRLLKQKISLFSILWILFFTVFVVVVYVVFYYSIF